MAEENVKSGGFITNIILEIVQSPLNIGLVCLIALLVYKIYKNRQTVPVHTKPEPKLPKLRKDFTVEELRQYDGNQADGRVLVAVNGNVYDVTKGKRFYGPGKELFSFNMWNRKIINQNFILGGPYAAFGGRDASRGLATFSVATTTDDYDDLSDLNNTEMESVREWEAQFKGNSI